MQQQSKLVRQEPMTTRAPAGEVQFEFLGPVLCVPAPRVMQVSLLRCDQLVTHHYETSVHPILCRLRLHDHAALLRPGRRLVEDIAILPATVALAAVPQRRADLHGIRLLKKWRRRLKGESISHAL